MKLFSSHYRLDSLGVILLEDIFCQKTQKKVTFRAPTLLFEAFERYFKDFLRTFLGILDYCIIASKQHVSVTLDAPAILGGAKNFPLDSSGFLLYESNWKKQQVLMLQLCFDEGKCRGTLMMLSGPFYKIRYKLDSPFLKT